jgi:hypothetical protein
MWDALIMAVSAENRCRLLLTEFIYVLDRVYQLPKQQIGRMVNDLIQILTADTPLHYA